MARLDRGPPVTASPLLNAVIFTCLGLVVFAIALAAMAKAAPLDIWKEIAERNVAAAILAGAVALGVAWIVAAAMH